MFILSQCRLQPVSMAIRVCNTSITWKTKWFPLSSCPRNSSVACFIPWESHLRSLSSARETGQYRAPCNHRFIAHGFSAWLECYFLSFIIHVFVIRYNWFDFGFPFHGWVWFKGAMKGCWMHLQDKRSPSLHPSPALLSLQPCFVWLVLALKNLKSLSLRGLSIVMHKKDVRLSFSVLMQRVMGLQQWEWGFFSVVKWGHGNGEGFIPSRVQWLWSSRAAAALWSCFN